MCMNRNYNQAEQEHIDMLASYAKRILMGASVAEIAVSEHITEADVHKAIDQIKEINPYLNVQIKAMLCGKQIIDGASINDIAKQENTTTEKVASWFEEIKNVDPVLYANVMDKIDI